MEKIFDDLIEATDEQSMLNTTLEDRNKAYTRVTTGLGNVCKAFKLCEDAIQNGEATPILERVDALLYVALNG